MNRHPLGQRVMMLIDADNVSTDVIEQAIESLLATHGAIHVRRAYCTAESALAHQQFFKRHSIRPIVNLSTGKNANDIALAVDGIDIALAERPDVAVIVSSDSDFAPLVIRLREKGCRVEGYGQQGKTGEDSKPVYDAFVDLPHRKARGAEVERAKAPARNSVKAPMKAPAKRTAAGARTRRPVVEAAAPFVAAVSPVPAAPSPSPPRPAPAPARMPAPMPAPAELPPEVRAILEQLPELRAGDTLELRIAAERLRNADLLTKSGSSTKLFKKYPELFMLTPERQPNKVGYTGPRQR